MANIKDPTVGFNNPQEAKDRAQELLSGSKIGSIDKGSARFAYKEAAAKLDLDENITPGQRAEVLKRVSGSLAGHIKKPRRYTAPINELEILFAATTMEELGEVFAKISHQEYLNNRNENAEAFKDWSSSTLANEFGTLSKQYIQKQKNERMANWNSNFGAVADLIDNDPRELAKSLPGFTSEMRSRMKSAGFDRGQIDRQIKSTEASAIEVAFHSLNRTDPEAAEQFASSNADALGMKVVNLKNTARKAQVSQAKERQKEEVRLAKAGFEGFNGAQIRSFESRPGPVGEAAKDIGHDINTNPSKLLNENTPTFNFNDDTSRDARIEAIDDVSARFSSPNRPVDIPYLGADSVSRLKKLAKMDVRAIDKRLNFLSQAKDNANLKMAREFGSDPLGQALRSYNRDPATARQILEGVASANPERIKKDDLAAESYFADPVADAAVKNSIRAISKVDDGTDNSIIEKVANVQTIKGIGPWATKSPVPLGYSGGQFKSTMEGLLKDPARLKKYTNGTIAGRAIALDYGDVEVVPMRYGVYALRHNDKWISTSDNKILEIDMIGALDGK